MYVITVFEEKQELQKITNWDILDVGAHILEVFLVVTKLLYKYQRNIHWKNYDDWFMNCGDV